MNVGTALCVFGLRAGAFADGDAVADGDLVWSDQDVLEQQPQHALAFFDGGDLGFVAERGEESFEVGGEREEGVAVGELAVERIYLVTQVGFSGAEVGPAGTQFVDGDQVLAERSIMAAIPHQA